MTLKKALKRDEALRKEREKERFERFVFLSGDQWSEQQKRCFKCGKYKSG